MTLCYYVILTPEQRQLLLDHYDCLTNKARSIGDRYGQLNAFDRRHELQSKSGVRLSDKECEIAGIAVERAA